MSIIRIAVQKKGRLHSDSIKLLKACGVNLNMNINSKLMIETSIKNIDEKIHVLFVRDDDIPKFVEEEIATIGIVGKNLVYEQKKEFLIKENLGFGFCRLSLAVHKESIFNNVEDLFKTTIATSYPNILKNFLNKKYTDNEISIHKINGCVEITPNVGAVDAICDLVDTGESLLSNDLKEIQQIFTSQAVLICKNTNNKYVNMFISQIQAIKKAKNNKYLFFNIPNNKLDQILSYLKKEQCKIVMINKDRFNLNDFSYTNVNVLVKNDLLSNIIEKLKINNATNLVVSTLQ